ncbi:MAG: M20/M25/M40 family metallo-hydrolase [Caulobacteraceae bacterium]
MRSVIFVLAVALGLLLAALALRPPSPRPASTALDGFSAARAMIDVRAIAQRAHPTGSVDIERVRNYVADRFRALGLDVSIHEGEGVDDQFRSAPNLAVAARVRNVVAILHGGDPATPAVAVMCHYDSVPNSPGAADDTAGVASALEIARGLKAGGPHRRDVVFLITDGEEAGLLGAQAFFAADPLRDHIGEVLNMETRGDAGRAAMFETGPRNGALIDLYRRTIAHPDANSLSTAVYRLMPNGTDLTRAFEAGHTGLNFAFIGDELAYHTPLATPAHLDQGSLQHMGEQVMAAARALADAARSPPPRSESVFFDLMGLILVVYPPWFGWVAILAAAALSAGTIRDARRTTHVGGALTSWSAISRGAGGLLLATTASALALRLAERAFGAGADREYALIGHFDLLLAGASILTLGVCLSLVGAMRIGLRRIAVVALALLAGAACSLTGGIDPMGAILGLAAAGLGALVLGKPVDSWGGWLGALLGGVAVAALVQILLPPGAFMLAWPLLIASAAAFATLRTGETRVGAPGAVWIAGLAATLVIAQAAVWSVTLFDALGVLLPAILAASVLIAFAALLPLADGVVSTSPGRLAALLIMVFGALLLTLAGTLGPTARRPGLTEATYVADDTAPGAPRAFRVDALPRLDPWARTVLSADGGLPRRTKLTAFPTVPIWNAPARRAPLPTPQVKVAVAPGKTTLAITPSSAGAEAIDLLVQPSFDFDTVELDGRSLHLLGRRGRWSEVSFQAPPASGVVLTLPVPVHGHLDLRTRELRDGWPASLSPPPKPRNRMGYSLSDKTEVVTRTQGVW